MGLKSYSLIYSNVLIEKWFIISIVCILDKKFEDLDFSDDWARKLVNIALSAISKGLTKSFELN